jgi:hypothetical protein
MSPTNRRAMRQLSERAGAIRMRWLRDRRRRGFRCVTVEVGVDDITGLIARGFLDRLQQDDASAVKAALHRWLDSLAQ